MDNSENIVSNCVQYKVPFSIAVKRFIVGYLTKIPSTKGRVSRSEFWWAVLFAEAFSSGVGCMFPDTFLDNGLTLGFGLLLLFMGWRRIHDIGKSGWQILIPIYNIYLCAQPSEKKENQYGPIPNTEEIKREPVWENISMGVLITSIVLVIVGFKLIILEGKVEGTKQFTQGFAEGLIEAASEM